MGYVRNVAMIVVDNGYGNGIEQAHTKAVEVFTKYANRDAFKDHLAELISPLIPGAVNGVRSFFIAPDGSKVGWTTEEAATAARTEFAEWLKANREKLGWIGFVTVAGFGGDDNDPYIADDSGFDEEADHAE
jgi:hypothetical protein